MRILIVTPYGFRPHLRSFPEFVLARSLAANGYHVEAVTLAQEGDPPSEMLGQVRVHRISRRNRPVALTRLVRGGRWNVLHVFHQRNPLGPWATSVARRSGVPVILSEYGLLHDQYLTPDRDRPLFVPRTQERVVNSLGAALRRGAGGPRALRDAIRSWWFHVPLFQADHLLFFSGHNIAIARDLGIPDHRMSWMSCFVDDQLYSPPGVAPASIEEGDGPVVLYIGQMKPRKGFDLFIRAAPRILARHPKARLIMVSSNLGDRALLSSLLRQSGCGDRIKIVEKASNAEKDALLARADVLVIPSRYEGFGLPILEAFAARTAVLATDVPAINETIRHRENGWLVAADSADAIAEGALAVLASAELRSQLVDAGERVLERFTVERHLPQILSLYRNLGHPARTGQPAVPDASVV